MIVAVNRSTVVTLAIAGFVAASPAPAALDGISIPLQKRGALLTKDGVVVPAALAVQVTRIQW